MAHTTNIIPLLSPPTPTHPPKRRHKNKNKNGGGVGGGGGGGGGGGREAGGRSQDPQFFVQNSFWKSELGEVWAFCLRGNSKTRALTHGTHRHSQHPTHTTHTPHTHTRTHARTHAHTHTHTHTPLTAAETGYGWGRKYWREEEGFQFVFKKMTGLSNV